MASFQPVRSVVRAIELLQALNGQPVSSIDTLHRLTGTPKPSLVRLLQTLESIGLVRHAPRYGAYYLTSLVSTLASGYHSARRIVEASAPVAEALTRTIKWPVAVAIFDADAMLVCYSTIPSSPLSLLQSTVNMRLSIVSRALGRAYLAFCKPDERRMILNAVSRTDRTEDRIARERVAMAKIIAETRRSGYALRDPSVRPVSGTIAVPIFDGKRVVASLGMTWITSALDSTQVVAQYLAPLTRAAQDISTRLADLATPTTAHTVDASARRSGRMRSSPRRRAGS
jgi:IclR family mhp operon transcriptional activator